MKEISCECGANLWDPGVECIRCGTFSSKPWESLTKTRLNFAKAIVKLVEGKKLCKRDEKAIENARFVIAHQDEMK